MDWNDTIVALATAPGIGAIGVIRLSGQNAITIADKLFVGKSLQQQNSHTLHVGFLKENDIVLDEVVASLFKGPKSYTGEEVVEISCHGSPFVQEQILQALLRQGARLARPGEFTQRAFLNGKLNLSQAESVADLIASENEAQHKMAISQLRGGIHKQLMYMREELITFAALIELELDFSQEDVEFADRKKLDELLNKIENNLAVLKNSFKYGNAIKNGIITVIAGRPNAGKSTLLNNLLAEERAIVSNIAGTTRDTIEEVFTIEGIQFRLIDTAGLRKNTTDEIEKIGIEKTKKSIDQAFILLYVFDLKNSTITELVNDVDEYLKNDIQLVLIGNKADLLTEMEKQQWKTDLEIFASNIEYTYCEISAKQEENLAALKNALVGFVKNENTPQLNNTISNTRHYQALVNALQAITEIKNGMANNLSGDLIAPYIRESLYYIGLITGQVEIDKDVLGAIFGKFCIGK